MSITTGNNIIRKVLGYDFIPETQADKDYISLLDYLQEKDLLTAEQIQIVLAEYSVSREPIGTLLVGNGFITHKEYIESIIEHNPETIYHEEMISEDVEPQLLVELNTMLIAKDGDILYLATVDEENWVREKIKQEMPGHQIVFLPVSLERIDSYLDKLKGSIYGESNFLEEMIRKALRMKASDVHILPKRSSYSMSFRIDGVMRLIHEGDMEEYYILMAKIKDRSKMDLAEKRIPQDGGFQVEARGRLIDMRVATIPITGNNEKIVIRLLDPDSVQPSMDLLGISALEEWRKGVSRPDGIALICGPTGSGKTTTLQASVREMDRFGRAIYSVEDPVEYQIPFIGQVNINRLAGLDFPNAIRAFMRADPDIILVGEIRDEETARVAIKGAETGHLVIGTLHTNSIRNTIDRLRDISVSNKEIRYILRSILVQRLMRTLCRHCLGGGCDKCNHQGYSGRTVISECKYFKDISEVDDMLEGNITWTSMLDDAVNKVNEGISDSREVIRVFGEEGERVLRERGMIESEESVS